MINTRTKKRLKAPPLKRSFNPAHDVRLMLFAFEEEHPRDNFTWHANESLRIYLTSQGYAKRLAKLEKLFPEAAR